jgi:hypothetical protein
MAANGRSPKGERDKPHIPDVITQTGDGSDTPKSIGNVITVPVSLGQVGGENEPHIANVITDPGPNK